MTTNPAMIPWERLDAVKRIGETYLNDDEAREDMIRAANGLPPLHGLMLR